MYTKAFWTAALERVIKAFVASLLALLVGGATDILSVPWGHAFAVAALAAVVSLLTSLASAGAGSTGPALFGPETVAPTAADAE
jgi:hypothetical protein